MANGGGINNVNINGSNHVEVTNLSDDEDDAIVIMRTPLKEQRSRNPRSARRSEELKKKHKQRPVMFNLKHTAN